MKNLKSQTTPGMLLGIGMIFFLFLLVLIFSINRTIDLHDVDDYIERRNECLKISNYINSVFAAGPGAQVQTETDYLITLYNTSLISIEDVASVNETGAIPRIAFVASEAGPTTQDFFNDVNAKFDPDPSWYKACFSGIGSSSKCDGSEAWMETSIPNNISDLMNNLNSFNTIYLEDPTIHYTTNYISLLENWTAAGNALILSEHVMCRETTSGTPLPPHYQCNPSGSNNDDWELFGVTISQRGGAWGWPSNWNVEVVASDEAFDMSVGERLSFEERPFVTDGLLLTGSGTEYEAESQSLSSGYSSSTSCSCSSPSNNRCARHSGSVGSQGYVTMNSFPLTSGQYEITVKYCDENDDNGASDRYNLTIGGTSVSTWQSTSGGSQQWAEQKVTANINSGNQVRISGIRGSSGTYARIDTITFDQIITGADNNFKEIARYRDTSYLGDSRLQSAIAYWDYGEGKVFYFGDFLVDYISPTGKTFAEVLNELISVAYFLVYEPEKNSDVTCTFSAFSSYQQISGDILIKNVDNYIVLENVNQTS